MVIQTLCRKHVLRCILLTLGWAYVVVPWASAHRQNTLGPYVVVIGWRQEPVIVGERNAITVAITQDGQPVARAETTLQLELRYGKSQRRATLHATATPGLYEVEMIPTVRGQYDVRLVGELHGVAIDTSLEPDEVVPAHSLLHFPDVQSDPQAFQAALSTLASQFQAVRTLALLGLGCGVLSMILAAVSTWRSRRTPLRPDASSKGRAEA